MEDLSDFQPRPVPGTKLLSGRLVRLEPYCADTHGLKLAAVIAGPENAAIWRYMPMDPFPAGDAFMPAFQSVSIDRGWSVYVILDAASSEALGTASYMRLRPEHGSCEVGCVAFSDQLKRTAHATEAMYLMARHVFEDLGYRRYEWKCHNENLASKRAAARFGFQFEGIFRNDMVMKGHNRDTAWFAMTNGDWPQIKADFETWLSPSNFDENGQQKVSLTSLQARHQMQQQQQ